MSTTTNDATILLRLPADLKAELLRAAAVSGRRITAEVNTRLRQSFEAAPSNYGPTHLSTHHSAQEKSPADLLTETDRAMLAVFRRMPVEKQLALLSLFK